MFADRPVAKTNRTNVIYKYPLKAQSQFDLELPADAKVLSVQMQRTDAQMWVLLDPKAPKITRTFLVIGTGWEFPSIELQFIGTFQPSPNLVFHLFEKVG